MVFLRTHQPYSGTEVLMETKLERIAEISASSPRPEFTSLYHLINKEMLLQCHKELDGSKAVGMDEIKNIDLWWMSGGCGNTFGIHRNKDCRAI